MLQKSVLRSIAPGVLADRGYEIRPRTGQGFLAGSRFLATKGGEEIDVAVKASVERSLSFTKLSRSRWRTASAVDLVLAVVPDLNNRADVEVLAFSKIALIAKFDRAWKALQRQVAQ